MTVRNRRRKFKELIITSPSSCWQCVDSDTPEIGRLGRNPDIAIMLTTKKSNLYPVAAQVNEYREDDLFDIIAFLDDHVSEPVVTETTFPAADAQDART